MRIFKWFLDTTDLQTLELPIGAKILTVQEQHGQAQIWALCDPDAPKQPRKFAVYGTGNPVPENPGRYIATYQLINGSLVFHVFEVS